MNKFAIAIGTVLVLTIFITTAVFILQGSKNNASDELAAACPKTYENDQLKFEYPCSWLLTSDDNDGHLMFTEFNQEAKNSSKLYFWIDNPKDGFSDSHSDTPSVCESGKYYSERKIMIPSFDGQEREACFHEEHAGQTLTIPSNRSETGYVSVSSETGLIESIIIPSLKVK